MTDSQPPRSGIVNQDEFSEASYLEANPDVASAIRQGAFSSGSEHYRLFGKNEGRMLKWFKQMTREEKALFVLNREGLGLEIGPSHNPVAPKRKGFNVHILDHLSAADLRKKYADHAKLGVNVENIEQVDFVWQGQPLPELIGRESCYDWIIASHVIEHVPDFVSFFQQCEKLMKPDGMLSLVVPDKRYCFDYFNPITSSGELLDAFAAKRTRPSPGKVFEHFANAAKRGGKIAWDAAERGPIELVHTFDQAEKAWRHAGSSEDYLDVHCWRFIPESFRLVLDDLKRLDLIRLGIVKEFDTFGCEFFVTLGKDGRTNPSDRIEQLVSRKAGDF